ncbi:MAG: hypothetical protein AB9919_07855 [Geobacteraceae bacterium]
MNKVGHFILATILLGVSLLFATPLIAATDGVYNLAETTATWDGTSADRLKAKTTDYDYSYGDESSVTYALPWSFPFYGQTYNQINADTNGNIWFTSSGSAHSINLANTGRGPVISAWNNDLSSYYYGGVFVQRKTSPERVVVQWQSESYSDEGYYRPNNFEVVLFPNGSVRLDYGSFSSTNQKDFSSGISQGDGSKSLSLTASVAPAPTLSGRSLLYINDAVTVMLTPSLASPQLPGVPLIFTATGSGGDGQLFYQFWLKDTSGVYHLVQSFSTTNTWEWTTTGLPAGTYYIAAQAKKAGSVAPNGFDAENVASFVLLPEPASTLDLVVTPGSPTVSLSATAGGGSGIYEYQFWLKDLSGVYTLVQSFSTANIYYWNTVGFPAGTYFIAAQAKSSGSVTPNGYDVEKVQSIVLP